MNTNTARRSSHIAWALAVQLLVLSSALPAFAADKGEYCGVFGANRRESCDAGLRCDIRLRVGIWRVGVCVPDEEICAGLQGLPCSDGKYCDFAPGAFCGAADQTGVCKDIPEFCTFEYAPVCGCDDTTYPTACAAHAKGISVVSSGACEPACKVGGCSGQLCVGPNEPDISTCIFRPEYACYRSATCEVQPNGGCGWTPTDDLEQCIENAARGDGDADAGVSDSDAGL